uniref:Uncharacterized protein n=1 Tax=Canis lupus familiaris TaxID=9615 RepID=A0A8C0QN78_CANLF
MAPREGASPSPGRAGLRGRAAAAPAGARACPRLPCLGSDSGPRKATRPRPPTSPLTFPPQLLFPGIPVPSPHFATPGSKQELQLSAVVTVLKETQSREPSGSRAAEKRRGWRPRGVPTPSGDRGPRAARLAARRGAGGTAGQQRLLQVPGASAVAAPRGLLRWKPPHPPPAPSAPSAPSAPAPPAPPAPRLPPAASHPRGEGPTVQNGRSLLVPAAVPLIPWPRDLQRFRGSPGIDLDNHD